MLSSKDRSTRQRLVEWNKETKRLMDIEIYGGGGIEPIHPECAYPDEKYIQDNEIYFIIDKTSPESTFRINRIEILKGYGVNVELGFIDDLGRFVNQNLEWGYTDKFISYSYLDEANHGESYHGEFDPDIVAIHLLLDITKCKENCIHSSFCIKITPLHEKQMLAQLYMIAVNSKYYWDITSFSAPENKTNASIIGIFGRLNYINRLYINKISTLLYCILHGKMSHEEIPFVLDENTAMRYVYIDEMMDNRFINIEESSSGGGSYRGVFMNCGSLLRSLFIDFEHCIKYSYMYNNCQSLTVDNIPHNNNEIYFNNPENKYNGELKITGLFYKTTDPKIQNLTIHFGPQIKKIDMYGLYQLSAITQIPSITYDYDQIECSTVYMFASIKQLSISLDRWFFQRTDNTTSMFASTTITSIVNSPQPNSYYFDFVLSKRLNDTFKQCDFTEVNDKPMYVNAPVAEYASDMFYNSPTLKLMPELNMPKCTDISNIFDKCKALETPIVDGKSILNLPDYIKTPIASSFNYAFYYASNLTGEIAFNNYYTKLKYMSSTFYGASKIESITGIDFSLVTSLYYTFGICALLTRVDNAHTMGNVTNFARAFYKTSIRNIYSLGDPDLTHVIDIHSATNMSYMFAESFALGGGTNNDLYDWINTTYLTIPECCTNMSYMFSKSNYIIGAFDIKGTPNMKGLYDGFLAKSLRIKIRFNRDKTYTLTQLSGMITTKNIDTELQLHIYNSGQISLADKPYTIFGLNKLTVVRSLELGGYINRAATDFIKVIKPVTTKFVNLQIHNGVIPRNMALFNFDDLEFHTGVTLIMALEPIRYYDVPSDPYSGPYAPLIDYKKFFNWGNYSGSNEIRIYLVGIEKWRTLYGAGNFTGMETLIGSDLFGHPAGAPSFRPRISLIDYDYALTECYKWPQEWIDDKK